MIRTLHDLPHNVANYAQYCIENYSVIDLVKKSQISIDHNELQRFDITLEQWQDAVFVALEELRDR